MLIRAILSEWAVKKFNLPKVKEGDFTPDQIKALNDKAYNIYYFPNDPKEYKPGSYVDGTVIDNFNWVFVDMDLKDGKWANCEDFIDELSNFPLFPSKIIYSGNGVHAYWKITDLDAKSFLKLQRRLCRRFNTDEAVSKICQLMRLEGYYNTKKEDNFILTECVSISDSSYTGEELAQVLPILTPEDEVYCNTHFDTTYNPQQLSLTTDEIPPKFLKLLKSNQEIRDLWVNQQDDRSKSDYRLAHLLFANNFTKEEATQVIMNTNKASSRAPKHQLAYAENIINKIWTFEVEEKTNALLNLSSSVKDILSKPIAALQGTRFPCWTYFDNTERGFRLGQVMGLVAGAGVGKTAFSLDMFMGFVKFNPDYDHIFIPLEQPKEEIAERWVALCGDNVKLHDKVHVLSNYDDNGNYRNLSLQEIEEYIILFQQQTGRKVGCVVIDHIGVLRKGKGEESQGLMDICHKLKAFAQRTNTLLVIQSQAPREKAGIGDLELNKDAAYGTVFFESYMDYLITVWQPLKRKYGDGAPTVTAYKFCKIRHKNVTKDKIQEDVPYLLYFDPESQKFRQLDDTEEKSFSFFNTECANLRKRDRKEAVEYKKLSL